MAAAQSVDEKRGVIFQQIKQSADIEKLNRYVGALLQFVYKSAAERPDALQIEGRWVGFGDIEDQLKRFIVQFNLTLPDPLKIPVEPFDIFNTKMLSSLIVALDAVDAYNPDVAKSNMPRDLHERVEEARQIKDAQLELGKKREDALSSMDRQIKASLEQYRYAQQLKLTAQAQLERMFLDSSYLKNLQDLEVALGGRGNLEQYVKEQVASLVERNISVLSVGQLNALIAKNPATAASYFLGLIQRFIDQDDLFRTAYFTAHPQAKKEALSAIEEDAKRSFEKAQPHAQVVEQERDALRAEGVNPDELNALSSSHRPVAEIRRWTQASLKIRTSEGFVEKLLVREAGKFGVRLNKREAQFLIGTFQRLNEGAWQGYLGRYFKSHGGRFSPSELNTLFRTIAPRLHVLAAFTPETIREAAQWRPDLLPRSVARALTSSTSSLALPEHQRAIQEVAEKTGVSVDHVEAYAAGLNRKTLDTHVAQAKLGAPTQSWFKNFREKSLPKLEEWFGPKGKIPAEPAPPGAPPQPAIAQDVAGNFRQLSGANAFRTRIGQAFRFLGVDRAVNFVARSAPIRAVTNVVNAPARFVNNAVTGVKGWAKSQLIAGATSIGKSLVEWGGKQAVKAGIMGFAGQAAGAAGKGLLALTGGTLNKIPFIGQAIGAVQAIGGATFGFLGASLDLIRGKKSFGEWGASAFKSAGTLIGAAVGGLLGGAIGLLGLGVGAIPGALIGVVIGAMVGGMLTGGLAKFAKDPAEVLKSLLGLLLIGGVALGALAGWIAGHGFQLIGALIGQGIFGVIGSLLGSVFGPLGALAGGLAGRAIGAYVGWKVGGAVGDWVGAGGPAKLWNSVSTFATNAWVGAGQFLGNLWAGVGNFFGGLLSTGQIALGNFLGWIGQAGMTLGGGILGGIGGFFVGGPVGALFGSGIGAGIGSWLGSGGLNSFLSGIGPAMTNSVLGATNFLGSLTAPLAASQIISTTTAVAMGGVAAAGGLTMLFVMPSILSALYVPPGTGTLGPGPGGGFADNASCPLLNPRISTTSYTSSTQTGHGSNEYWQSINSGNPCYWPNGAPASIPQGMGCYAPDDPGSVCYSVHYPNLCPYYGFAIDVVSLNGTDGTTPVYLPQINGQDVTWSYVGPSQTSDTLIYGWIHTYTSGEYKLILTHLQASVVGGSSIVSGTQIGLLHYQETSAGFNNTHVHIEFAINNVFQRPEDYFCGTGGP